jgi:uncharacterized SAM-binding protein YcdF (DUF218 family)
MGNGKWKTAFHWGRRALAVTGFLTLLTLGWLVAGFPLGIDGWLNVASAPTPADAIVCIGGGTTSNDLPTADGWQRVYTTTQLHLDRFAPLVIFTGRGNAKVSEAEAYADAARWLGVPREVTRLDPLPASTAEHPQSLLTSLGGQITRDSRLLLVTSRLHSRRVLLTFRKHGFTNVTVVSSYRARTRSAESRPAESRRTEVSALPTFRRDNKSYGDPLFTLGQRSTLLFTALREWAAIALYRVQGKL